MYSQDSPPQLPNPEVSVATGFALMLETACEDFEILQRMIRHDIKLVSGNGIEDYRASPRIQMALAKSFLFNLVRARRICEHGAGLLAVDRTERTRFLKATAAVVDVRDVNEHGFDAGAAGNVHRSPGSSRGKIAKPSMHSHAKESAILDETSMTVLGDQKILMGPLNLYDAYIPTDRMRKLAGFPASGQLSSNRDKCAAAAASMDEALADVSRKVGYCASQDTGSRPERSSLV